jgi:hypothetical protein
VVLLAGAALSYRYAVGLPAAHRAALRRPEAMATPIEAQADRHSAGPGAEGYSPDAVRANARVTLRQCLKQATAASQAKWNAMCAYVADRNATEYLNCRQQGRGETDCRSAYATTPTTDCLLPHAMASSIYEAAQSAKQACYRQFQIAVQ